MKGEERVMDYIGDYIEMNSAWQLSIVDMKCRGRDIIWWSSFVQVDLSSLIRNNEKNDWSNRCGTARKDMINTS